VLVLGATALLVDSLSGPAEWTLIMTGHVKLEMLANVVAGVVLVGTAIGLVAAFGLVGAAFALLVYNVVLNGLKTALVWHKLRVRPFGLSLLGPLAAAAIAAGAVAAPERLTGLGSSLLGAVVLGLALLVLYALLLVRVIGISPADRSALRLAIRPAP
jgi:O-antigen/teichoic acid export membrane protein